MRIVCYVVFTVAARCVYLEQYSVVCHIRKHSEHCGAARIGRGFSDFLMNLTRRHMTSELHESFKYHLLLVRVSSWYLGFVVHIVRILVETLSYLRVYYNTDFSFVNSKK